MESSKDKKNCWTPCENISRCANTCVRNMIVFLRIYMELTWLAVLCIAPTIFHWLYVDLNTDLYINIFMTR